MNRFLRCVVTAALAIAAANAYSANVWKSNIAIQRIESLGDGSFAIYAPAGTDAACQQNGTYFQVTAGQNSMTTDGVKGSLAVALTAFAAGKTITFAADTATSQCYSANITINP